MYMYIYTHTQLKKGNMVIFYLLINHVYLHSYKQLEREHCCIFVNKNYILLKEI